MFRKGGAVVVENLQGKWYLVVDFPMIGGGIMKKWILLSVGNPEEALQILESKKSLFHILGKFVLACGRKGLAQKSIQNYIEFVSPFFLNSSIEKIEDINLATIDSYSIELFLTERQLSKQSISTYLRHIKVFFRWCEKEYNIIGRYLQRVPKV